MTAPNTQDDADLELPTGSAFSRALARVEHHRTRVQAVLALTLVARLFGDFDLVALVQNTPALIAEVPTIGVALLSYLIVLWFLAARTRDRFGFAMALGIGVLQATFFFATPFMQGGLSIATEWPSLVVGAAHVCLAFVAFRAAAVYPPRDSKRPWIVGFVSALIFTALPWVAAALLDAVKRTRG